MSSSTPILRPLTGSDELFFSETAALTPARRTTAILARAFELSEDDARSMTAGEREAGLLRLRRATFGDEIEAVLACPREGCGATMDVALRAGDLLVAQDARPGLHEAHIGPHSVSFRLPNGADLEEAALLAPRDLQAAVHGVLARCIASIDGVAPEVIPEEIASALPARMAELDPQAEMVLNATCTRCGLPFQAIFDTAAFLFRELSTHARFLFGEIHELALRYHWPESEILALPVRRRRIYLELLAESGRTR